MIIRFFGYVMTAFVVVLVLLLGFVCMGCNTGNGDTSVGKHRLLETWDMKRYAINQEYKLSKEQASKIYAATVFKVYGETENLSESRIAGDIAYYKHLKQARNTRQLKLMGLNGDKWSHYRLMAIVKSK